MTPDTFPTMTDPQSPQPTLDELIATGEQLKAFIVAALDALQAQAAASPPEQSVTFDVHGSDIAVTSEQVNVTVFPQTRAGIRDRR